MGLSSDRICRFNPARPLKIRDFADDSEVCALVRAFENATISPAEFRHAAHIAVALSYLAVEPLAEASARMRRSLLNFSRCHGLNVYHETTTHFWMKLLDHLAATHYCKVPLWRRINLIVERWAAADPIGTHYSHRTINSRAARESWVDPDRLPLPF
jgi:hypothetical protein